MKILFTADLHIKLGQKNIPKDWQINRYRELFKRLNTLQHSADIMILGGDIFDRIPTLEELELYFREVIKLDQEDIVSTMRVFNDYYKEANME
jgi:DNA repair exonuclease SbcCD nuclease subunit